MSVGCNIVKYYLQQLLILLLFGSAKLPSLMRNLGRSAVEFKKGVHGVEEEMKEAVREDLEDLDRVGHHRKVDQTFQKIKMKKPQLISTEVFFSIGKIHMHHR